MSKVPTYNSLLQLSFIFHKSSIFREINVLIFRDIDNWFNEFLLHFFHDHLNESESSKKIREIDDKVKKLGGVVFTKCFKL